MYGKLGRYDGTTASVSLAIFRLFSSNMHHGTSISKHPSKHPTLDSLQLQTSDQDSLRGTTVAQNQSNLQPSVYDLGTKRCSIDQCSCRRLLASEIHFSWSNRSSRPLGVRATGSILQSLQIVEFERVLSTAQPSPTAG